MKQRVFNVFSRYPAYFFVGSFVTLVTIVVRDMIGRLLHGVNGEYIISIAIVYAFGIVLSYCLQSRFTFKTNRKQPRSSKYEFYYYVILQLLGMGVTIACSLLIRHMLSPITVLVQCRDTIAFVIASLIASVMTYGGSKFLIFNK
jgi:putative flippase GtrA